MNKKIIIYLAIFFLCGAAIGLWVGQRATYSGSLKTNCRPVKIGELDAFYTDILGVSGDQKVKLLEIETQYQKTRDHFAKRMHSANIKLAAIIEEEGYESDKIAPTVVEIHTAMGELQTLSLTHLATIEKILQPEQARLLKKNAIARLRQN